MVLKSFMSIPKDTNGLLSKVIYPDGTESSYSYSVTEDGYTQAEIFDAGEQGYNRKKVAYYSGVSAKDRWRKNKSGIKYYSISSNLLRKLYKGDELVYENGTAQGMGVVAYEGGNKIKQYELASSSLL